MHLFPHSGPTKLGNENHIERHFFQNTELTTYHCIIMRILKKNNNKIKKLKKNIKTQ